MGTTMAWRACTKHSGPALGNDADEPAASPVPRQSGRYDGKVQARRRKPPGFFLSTLTLLKPSPLDDRPLKRFLTEPIARARKTANETPRSRRPCDGRNRHGTGSNSLHDSPSHIPFGSHTGSIALHRREASGFACHASFVIYVPRRAGTDRRRSTPAIAVRATTDIRKNEPTRRPYCASRYRASRAPQ
jgi:hypothetical protein